jgi:histidyl-tRNA synthetase
VTDQLGSQATVCAGGRFDKLVEHLGGKPTSAVGFALGIERLILLMETLPSDHITQPLPQLFMMAVGHEALQNALILAELLRDASENWSVIVNTDLASLKSQFKKADKSGAHLALIIGPDEVKSVTISMKDLRMVTEQVTIPQSQLIDYIKNYLQ